ncbi:MAG: hypothetical protein WBA16_08690 [Nonlabens sp.]
MKAYLFLAVLLIAMTSCEQNAADSNQTETTRKQSRVAFMESKIALVGDAAQEVAGWSDYQLFTASMRDYDHTPSATKELEQHVSNMYTNTPAAFNESYYKSRIKVLQTRLAIYLSYLNAGSNDRQLKKTKFDNIILAWDELKYHLNDRINEVNKGRQQLLELLTQERIRDSLKAIKKDSLRGA